MNWLWKRGSVLAAAALLIAGCATVPSGPSVMVLPGHGKDFSAFQSDDAICRGWAAQQTGINANRAAARSGMASAAVGTAVGAAAGAAIGAASGNAGEGAAIGAGSGLLVGSAAGSGTAAASGAEAQRRYDNAYIQCMYAKGNQVPVAGQLPAPRYSGLPQPTPSIPPSRGNGVPPPPPGAPPPPPPGAY
jgi:hypothetical protein